MVLPDVFITFIYQPFFNILVGFYWLLGKFTQGSPDMGIAVIFLTILIRIILLPMSFAGHKSEKERRKIARQIKEVEDIYVTEPIKLEAAKKKILKKSGGVVTGELITLFIQVMVALMLYKIFKTGLEGEDLHLIYPFMPEVAKPFNLIFLGEIDLSKTNLLLNFIQSILIFILETISMYTSPYRVSKNEVVRMQLVLPIVSFLVFMLMPAGKKLFVITSLIISIIITSIRAVTVMFNKYKDKKEAEFAQEQAAMESGQSDEKIVVKTE